MAHRSQCPLDGCHFCQYLLVPTGHCRPDGGRSGGNAQGAREGRGCSGSQPLDKLWNYFGAATLFASTRVLAQVRQIVRPVLRQRGGPFDARLRPAPVRRVIDGEKSGVSLRGRLLTRACRRYRSGCGCAGIWFGTGRGTSGLPKGHSSAVRSQRSRVAAASYVLMRNSIKAWSGSSAVRTAS